MLIPLFDEEDGEIGMRSCKKNAKPKVFKGLTEIFLNLLGKTQRTRGE